MNIEFISLDEPSSCHLLVPLEDLLKRSDQSSILISKKKCSSKSVDDLLLYQHTNQFNAEQTLDLSCLADDDDQVDYFPQRSRSAPTSPNRIYEKELAAFIDCDQPAQQFSADNFVFNVDLSNPNEASQSSHSKLAIFFVGLSTLFDLIYVSCRKTMKSFMIHL